MAVCRCESRRCGSPSLFVVTALSTIPRLVSRLPSARPPGRATPWAEPRRGYGGGLEYPVQIHDDGAPSSEYMRLSRTRAPAAPPTDQRYNLLEYWRRLSVWAVAVLGWIVTGLGSTRVGPRGMRIEKASSWLSGLALPGALFEPKAPSVLLPVHVRMYGHATGGLPPEHEARSLIITLGIIATGKQGNIEKRGGKAPTGPGKIGRRLFRLRRREYTCRGIPHGPGRAPSSPVERHSIDLRVPWVRNAPAQASADQAKQRTAIGNAAINSEMVRKATAAEHSRRLDCASVIAKPFMLTAKPLLRVHWAHETAPVHCRSTGR
ncbi:hypothetical protein CDD83_11239 [Cordyceps sp. RAO-2017]|nr:hypothetical protein CDD83_11239 [Cordyceps sp. RAO-2017]